MKTKKPSLSKAKQKAWAVFSLYIRTKGWVAYKAIHPEYNGEPVAQCVTCKRVFPIKQLHAGHFVPGRTNAILFDERGVHPQCYRCNIGEHGNPLNYWLFMEETYGRPVIDELMGQRNQTLKMKVWDYDELRDKYQELLASLT